MSQKINPISFRLGVSQLWPISFQIYGKSFGPYKFLNDKISNYYNFYYNFLQFDFLLQFHKYFFLFLATLLESFEKKQINIFFQILIKISNFKLFTQFFFIPYFQFLNLNLIIFYLEFCLKKKVPISKILKNFNLLFEKNKNFSQIIVTKTGPLEINFQGFKILIKGRFGNSKNQMSKYSIFSYGNLPLNSFCNIVEFKKTKFYSKSGIIGLKIWFFYCIK